MENNTILSKTENKRGDFCFVFELLVPIYYGISKSGQKQQPKINKLKKNTTNKQPNKPTNKQSYKQTNKQTNKQNSSFILSK